MFSKFRRLKKIGVGLAIWGFAKAIWDAIGHIGNVQTLWDMVSGAVQYWPDALRGSLWIATSWWFPLILSALFLVLWYVLTKKAQNHSVQLSYAPNLASVQDSAPTTDLSNLADPAYDPSATSLSSADDTARHVPSHKAEECLSRAAQLIKEKKDGIIMNFHGLYRARAYELESNDDLIWVCDKLVEHGYSHPFKGLDECMPQNEWLDFMRWGHLHANWNFGQEGDYLRAAIQWSNERGRPFEEKKVWRGVMAEVLDEHRYGHTPQHNQK